MQEKVEAPLDQIRVSLTPMVVDVQLVVMKEGTAAVRLTGACGGCPMAAMTLRHDIEQMLKERVPQVKEVIAV